ncbi:hypothetical protein ACW5XX_00755 [Aeromonas mytilicola]|nr:hypothetical protein [Aeromonadaceae bacterium]
MTLPTHKQLMLDEIAASKALSSEHIASELAQALKLREAGFSTQAFLHLWIVTEVAVKELMCIYKYTKDTHEALKKLQPELKRSLQPHLNAPSKKVANEQAMTLTAKALPSLVSSFHSVFKSAAQTNCRHLDMAVIKSVFAVLKQAIDEIRLDYLLATKFKAIPEGVDLKDKTTVRNWRNKLVHTNGHVDDKTLAQLLPIFDYFFSLLQQLSTLSVASQQPDLNEEVAQ